MSAKKMLWLAGWLTLAMLAVSACGPAQPPSREATQTASPLSPLEQNQAEYKHDTETAQLKPVSLGAGEKLQVVATTNIIADMVLQVGRDAIELIQLLPPGADPHTYTATPQDMVAMTDAHIIFANGANLEAEFLPKLIQQIDTPVVYASQGVELRELGTGEAQGQAHKSNDPHTWTTPVNAVVFVHNIEYALSALDPANTEVYRTNAQQYQAELTALDEWVKEQIATIPANNRKLVTDHETFGYYADRYGLEQIGAVIPGFSTAAEPSARELAALEDIIREHGIRAVFVGTTVNPSLVQQVAADTGIKLVTLYTGSLGPPGSGVEMYTDYIRYNTLAIVDGLR